MPWPCCLSQGMTGRQGVHKRPERIGFSFMDLIHRDLCPAAAVAVVAIDLLLMLLYFTFASSLFCSCHHFILEVIKRKTGRQILTTATSTKFRYATPCYATPCHAKQGGRLVAAAALTTMAIIMANQSCFGTFIPLLPSRSFLPL